MILQIIFFLYTLIGVALIEEGFKYLLLIKFFFPLKDFDEPYDGIFLFCDD